MMTVDEIVEGCGGTSALAAELELTPSVVSSWREVNFIPRWWITAVLSAAERRDFHVSQNDFPPKSARLPRKRATGQQADAA